MPRKGTEADGGGGAGGGGEDGSGKAPLTATHLQCSANWGGGEHQRETVRLEGREALGPQQWSITLATFSRFLSAFPRFQ